MPTSIAHGVAGYAVAEAGDFGYGHHVWTTAAFVLVVANLPDIDFLFGILSGRPNAAHRTFTHSLPVAIAVAAALGAYLGRGRRSFGTCFLFVLLLYLSHLGLDLVAPDTRPPAGIPLFWPFSDAHLWLPVPLPDRLVAFLDLDRGAGTGAFMDALLSRRALAVFLVEGILVTPLLPIAFWYRRLRES